MENNKLHLGLLLLFCCHLCIQTYRVTTLLAHVSSRKGGAEAAALNFARSGDHAQNLQPAPNPTAPASAPGTTLPRQTQPARLPFPAATPRLEHQPPATRPARPRDDPAQGPSLPPRRSPPPVLCQQTVPPPAPLPTPPARCKRCDGF